MTISIVHCAVATLATQALLPGSTLAANTNREPFSSAFQQPAPPSIEAGMTANWNQHKWDVNVSNIASGYIYISPTARKVRVDQAYDSVLSSSLFNYNNVSSRGVGNTLWTLSPSIASSPMLWQDYVQPAFPLLEVELLIQSNAVFAGNVKDAHVGAVSAWNILYQGVLPTTVLVDEDHVVRGYDFWSPELRTFTTTRFFNIRVGNISAEVFDFPQ